MAVVVLAGQRRCFQRLSVRLSPFTEPLRRGFSEPLIVGATIADPCDHAVRSNKQCLKAQWFPYLAFDGDELPGERLREVAEG